MTSSIIFSILFSLAFLGFGIYIIHLYSKHNRKLFFDQLGTRKYTEMKNIYLEVIAKNKLSYNHNSYKTDFILCDDNIFAVPQMDNLFMINQPIIQLTNKQNNTKYKGVTNLYIVNKKEIYEGKIKYFTILSTLITSEVEIIVKLGNNEKQLESINQYL